MYEATHPGSQEELALWNILYIYIYLQEQYIDVILISHSIICFLLD